MIFKSSTFALFLFVSILFTSCGSSTNTSKEKKTAFCFSEENKNIRITWGQRDSEEHRSNGFQLLTDGTVLFFAYDSVTTKTLEKEIAILSEETVCHIHERLKLAIIKTQALYVPGKVSRYVSLTNPYSRTTITGLWNAEFANFGSQYYREVYDTLNTIVSKQLPESSLEEPKQ